MIKDEATEFDDGAKMTLELALAIAGLGAAVGIVLAVVVRLI